MCIYIYNHFGGDGRGGVTGSVKIDHCGLRGAITKKTAKVGTDVPTPLVGENGIAREKKVITGRKKSMLGEKCMVLTKTQFIQKINKKNPTKKFTY